MWWGWGGVIVGVLVATGMGRGCFGPVLVVVVYKGVGLGLGTIVAMLVVVVAFVGGGEMTGLVGVERRKVRLA